MKRLRNIVTIATLVLVPLGLTGAASAAPATATTTTIHLTLVQYRAAAKQINHTFSSAVKRAHTILKKAEAAARFATDPADVRLNAMYAYQAAIIAATNARESALSALGPVPPGANRPASAFSVKVSPSL